jgi:uncharacterized DUF497 family protein
MSDPLASLSECTGFEWDTGNADKNWIRHKVSQAECEGLFFNQPIIVEPDDKHSGVESRLYVLGQTDEGRRLFVVVTIRGKLIRVISARDMSRREEKEYEDAQGQEGSS